MKSFGVFVFLMLLAVLGEAVATAQELVSSSDYYSRPQHTQHTFQHTFLVAAGLHRFDYQETVPAPKKSTESGTLPSAVLGYRYEEQPLGSLFLARIEGAFAVSTQYDGTDQSGKRPISDSTQNRFFELEAEFATPAVEIQKASVIRAYAGGGYHYWQRGEGATAAGAYREDYRWPLIIGGLLFSMRPLNRLNVDLDLAARWQFKGAMKVYLSQISEKLQDATVNLGNRVGFKAQLPLSYRIYGNTSLLVSPWAEWSSIGESDPVAVLTQDGTETGFGVREPASRTIQYGSSLGVSIGL